MAKFYKTGPSAGDIAGMARLIPMASQSPLQAMGKSMTELSDVLTRRDKEQYSKGIPEQIRGVGSLGELIGLKGTLDPARITPEATAHLDKLISQGLAFEKQQLTDTTGKKRDQLKQLSEATARLNMAKTTGDEGKIREAQNIYDRLFKGQAEVTDTGSKALMTKLMKEDFKFDAYNKDSAIDMETSVKTDKNIYTTQLRNQETDYKKQAHFTKQLVEIEKDFAEAVKKGKYKSGPWDSALQWISKKTPETFEFKDIKDVLPQQALDTKLGRVLSERLKYLSGTAVSQAEFDRVKAFMMGMASDDESIRANALKTFLGEEVNSLKIAGETLGSSGLPHTAKRIFDKTTEKHTPIQATTPSQVLDINKYKTNN